LEGLKANAAAVALSVCLILPQSLASAQQDRAAASKRVLVLYWYNRRNSINLAIEQGFQAQLRSAPGSAVQYYSEYLESDQFPGELQAQILHDYLQQKYAELPIDVVVAAGDATFEFLLRFRRTLFPRASLVFIGNPPLSADTGMGPGITGIAAYREYRKRIDLVLRLHPGTNHVFIISGTINADKRLETVARAELARDAPNVAVTYLTDLPVDQLVARVRALPPRSVILFAWQQSRGNDGGVLEPPDILAAIAPAASVPIYGMSASRLGGGIVGGDLLSAEGNGKRAAQIALRILNGERAEDIPIQSPPTTPMFDWREVQRWKIPEWRLPPGSIIQFREPTIWDQYRWYILAAIGICTVQAALITLLLVQRASRKRAEMKAHSRQRELTHMNRVATVGELTGALAHEVGQPLTAILANAQAARQLLARDTVDCTELRDTLDDIIDNDRRAAEVISRLRRMLRRNEMAREEVDLNDVVSAAISLSASELAMRAVSVSTILRPDLPTIVGDRVELQQVVLNLILNACDAIGGLPIAERKLTVRTDVADHGTIQVSVTDHGPGLTVESIEKVFKPFYTTKADGLGLGLAICRRIIDAHDGHIWAENNAGAGATFSFSVPKNQRVPSPIMA
jgi:signal transduction histidine kinase